MTPASTSSARCPTRSPISSDGRPIRRTPWAPPGATPRSSLTCGVGRPADYDPVNGCTTVNGVDWYVPTDQLDANGDRDLTMTTIGRTVAVEVVMPGEYWPPATTLADLSTVVAEHTRRTGRCV